MFLWAPSHQLVREVEALGMMGAAHRGRGHPVCGESSWALWSPACWPSAAPWPPQRHVRGPHPEAWWPSHPCNSTVAPSGCLYSSCQELENGGRRARRHPTHPGVAGAAWLGSHCPGSAQAPTTAGGSRPLRCLPHQAPPVLTPRSLDSGVLEVGCGEGKFQTFMQKSFTCKPHLKILPRPMCSFSILQCFSFCNSSLLQLLSPWAPPSCCPVRLQAGFH